MSLSADERAQSIQIGAVLIFGLLVILLAMYQAFVVPDQNRQVESSHLDEVSQQMHDLRNAIVSVPSTHFGRSITLTLGTDYPPRVMALNPSPPVGAVRTVGTTDERANLTVTNAVGAGDVVDEAPVVSERSYNTGGLAYFPGYNEYRNAPEIVYENSVLYDRFRTGTLTSTGQRLVDGRRITLVTLNGSLDTASSGPVAMDLDAVSASSRRLSITNVAGENVTINFASQLNASQWETEFRDDEEFADQSGHVVDVTDSPIADSPFQVVHVELERDETYLLRMAKVGVGTGIAPESEAYLIDHRGDGVTVEAEQNTTLVVEVRDGLNNPVSGVQVNATAESGSISSSEESDEDGRAAFEYEAPSDTTGEVAINFSYTVTPGIGFDVDAPENVSMTVTVSSGGGGGGGGSGGQTLQTVGSVGDEVAASGDRLVFVVENTGSSTVTVEQFAVDAVGYGNTRIDDGNAEELEIRRATQNGFANRNSPGANGRFEADGTTYDLVADSDSGQYADIASDDDDVEVDFRTFDTNLGTLEIAGSAGDADLIVTLTLSDGSTQEFYFRQR